MRVVFMLRLGKLLLVAGAIFMIIGAISVALYSFRMIGWHGFVWLPSFSTGAALVIIGIPYLIPRIKVAKALVYGILILVNLGFVYLVWWVYSQPPYYRDDLIPYLKFVVVPPWLLTNILEAYGLYIFRAKKQTTAQKS